MQRWKWFNAIIIALQIAPFGCKEDREPSDLTIAETTLADAVVGEAYDAALALAGQYDGSVEWRIVNGALPAGLMLVRSGDRAAAIRGTPEEPGEFTFTVRAAGSAGGEDQIELTLVVHPSLSITTASLPNGTVGEAYSAKLDATGGTSFTWTIADGSLPPGLELSSGSITGVPTEPGMFTFTVRVENERGRTAERELQIEIAGVPLEIVTLTLGDGGVGAAYSVVVVASGGTGEGYRWRVSSGALPDGLSLREERTPSTVIEGTPTTAGTYEFELEVIDSADQTARKSFTIEILADLPPLILPDVALADGIVGLAYTATISASGGSGDYAWTVIQGELPPGLTLAPDGRPSTTIFGTPESAGEFVFAVRVRDSAQQIADRTLRITITAVDPLAITTTELPAARVGRSYSAAIEATGGLAPYQWRVEGLPPGLTFTVVSDLRVEIAGDPTMSGDWSVAVSITDAIGTIAERELDLTITELSIMAPPPTAATECQPYSATFLAIGGDGSYTWTASGLPAGLFLSASTGVETRLEGEPAVPGVHPISISVADGAGSATVSLSLEVVADPASRRWVALVGDLTRDGDTGIHVARTCGSGTVPAVLVSPAAIGFGDASATATDQVRFSPDGQSIAFVGDFRLDGVNELFVASLDPTGHGPAIRVSGDQNAGGLVSDFRWSPDGTRLVYRADQITDGQFELFFVDLMAPGSSVRVNPDFPVGGTLSADDFYWSPDGRWVAYHADGAIDGVQEVYLADMSSGPPFAVYPANTPLPANGDVFDDFRWLPGGEGIVIRSDMLTDGVDELFVVDTRGATPGAPMRVNGDLVSGGDVSAFAISADGTIAYLADERTNDQIELFVARVTNATPAPSTVASAPLVAGGNVTAMRWSDDGARLLYRADGEVDERFDLYVVEDGNVSRISGDFVAGGNVRADALDAPSFGFSPDGRWAAFIADAEEDGADGLHVVLLDRTPVTMVNEEFADGTRTTQNPPSSLAWVTSGSASTLTVLNGAMTLSTGGTSGRHAVAHFPAVSLEVGETIALDFDFSVTAPIDLTNGLRFGLFNSGGTPVIVSDGNNPSVTHRGYAAFTNLVPAGPNASSIRERDSATAGVLITASAAFTALGSNEGPAEAFEDGVVYHATLAVERIDAEQVAIRVRYSGGALSEYEIVRIDSANIVSTFDVIALCLSSSSGSAAALNLTVRNVSVTQREGFSSIAIAPHATAGRSVRDFRFSPDSNRIAFRGDLNASGIVEIFAASLVSGPDFGLGNVLHAAPPAGGGASTLPVDLAWSADSSRVLAVGALQTAGVVEAWALDASGAHSAKRLHPAAPSGGDVAFMVVPE